MKKIFWIMFFLLLATPVFAADVPFLSNQSGVPAMQFSNDDEIYIEGICLPANQEPGKVYITPHQVWQTGYQLFDISGGIETFTNSATGGIPRTRIWNKPPNAGTYDVVIDTNNNLKLEDYEKQCIISGFTVGNPTPPPPPPVTTPPPAPVPDPVPAPSPSVSTKPSVVFSLDDGVVTKSLANIRKSPGGTLIGTQEKGALGVVIGGPVQESVDGSNFWFWNINFENRPDGWVAASMIKSVPPPAPEPVVEETVKEPLADTVATTTATTIIKETSKEEVVPDKATAQVSGADIGSGSNPFTSSLIIGLALFFGLICSSFIIARALRKN